MPALLQRELEGMQQELAHRLTSQLIKIDKQTNYADQSRISYQARREMKNTIYRLMDHYARLDAWQSMAKATLNNKWVFPSLKPATPVLFDAKEMYHPLLQQPVPYSIDFSNKRTFLLLTGANMSGKTTFMRSLGVKCFAGTPGHGCASRFIRH